jgi:hypothetical protein
MKERSAYQIITEAKSAPVGVDWLMIRSARGTIRRQKDSQKQVRGDSGVDNRKDKRPT